MKVVGLWDFQMGDNARTENGDDSENGKKGNKGGEANEFRGGRNWMNDENRGLRCER